MRKFRRAIQIYKNRGLQYLLYRMLDRINSRLKNKISKVINIYYDNKGGEQTFKIKDVSAEFGATRAEGGNNNRARINTEYDLIEDLLENIEQGDTFYDVGANTGLISNFAGQICSKVVAFEPYQKNYDQLNKELSNLPADIHTYNLALADSEGEADFSVTGRTGQGTGSIGSGNISVKKTSGDKIISEEGLQQPDIIKIDVEGAEGLVISGMKDALTDARRIYCEIHLPADHRTSIESYGWTITELLNELEQLGFKISFLNNRGTEIQAIAQKN